MYKLKVYPQGRFEIYNTGRDKIVFSGLDSRLIKKSGDTYRFDNVRDLMSEIVSWVSIATLRKISTKLCAW